MKIQVLIGTGTGRAAEVLDAPSSYEALMQRLQDAEVAARLRGLPYAHIVIMAGPFDPTPGKVPDKVPGAIKAYGEGAKQAA